MAGITKTQQDPTVKTVKQTLESMGWKIRYNGHSGSMEFKPGPTLPWTERTEEFESYIKHELRELGIKKVGEAIDSVVAEAWKTPYFSIREYLNSLKYEGGQQISKLAKYFANPDGMFETWLTRWLIGSIRRIIENGAQNRILVLSGPQRIGKSKFAAWLCPQILRDEGYFKASAIYPDNEDHKRHLTNTWIWEINELASTTRRQDVDALKGFVSLERLKFRKKFAKGDTNKTALTSFIGTINNVNGALNDPSGSKRFMFAEITEIDWQGYTQILTPDQIWAEAYMRYLDGEPADLTPNEIKRADEINAEYQIENPIKDILLEYFEIDPSQTSWFTWTSDIEKMLQDPPLEEVPNGINPLSGQPVTRQTRLMYRGTQDKLRKDLAGILLELGCDREQRRKPGSKLPQRGYIGVRGKV